MRTSPSGPLVSSLGSLVPITFERSLTALTNPSDQTMFLIGAVSAFNFVAPSGGLRLRRIWTQFSNPLEPGTALTVRFMTASSLDGPWTMRAESSPPLTPENTENGSVGVWTENLNVEVPEGTFWRLLCNLTGGSYPADDTFAYSSLYFE